MTMRILCFDGGGANGLTPGLVVAGLEARLGKPIAKCFDLICGTSAGGYIALGLGAGIPAERIAEFFVEKSPAIFSRSLRKRLESVGGLTDELYDAGELEVGLHELFGGRLLSEVETRVMVTAYDIEAVEPVMLRSYGPEQYHMAEVARATSAAPTYFEPYRLTSLGGRTRTLIDGGVVANNPAMAAYVEARQMDPYAAISMVSLGTGRNETPFLYKDAKDAGLPEWARQLLAIMFGGGAELMHDQCAALLGENYVRLQADLPRPVAMDATDAKSMAIRRMAAGRLLETQAAKRALELAVAA